MQISSLAGDTRDIAGETLGALVAELEGSVILPGDEGFAEAIAIWNGMITKRPAVVDRKSVV